MHMAVRDGGEWVALFFLWAIGGRCRGSKDQVEKELDEHDDEQDEGPQEEAEGA